MKIIRRIIEIFNHIRHFIMDEVWSVRLDEYPRYIAILLKYLRVILVSVRRFGEDKVQLRASALTYYALLSLVPILAMGFGIAKGFGFNKDLEQKLIENFKGQEEVLNWLITFANSMLNTAKGGVIAGVGLAVLLWSVMKMMGNIELSLNDIWQIKKGRSYVRKFTDYMSMMLIAPIFIILASSGKVYMAAQLNSLSSSIDIVNLSPFVLLLMKVVPYVMTWLLFTVIYIIMPNTKVKFQAAFTAGVIAGTAFLVTQWLYIELQMGMSRYNVIYGSFAALPLLLIWMHASWLIILLGAEVSFAKQNIDQYELENESLQISAYAHRAYCILLLGNVVRHFVNGDRPLTAQDMSFRMKLPTRLVRSVVSDLLASDLIDEVYTEDDKTRAYAPAKDVRKYTVKYVIESLDKSGNNHILDSSVHELSSILHIQENFLRIIEQAPDNILLQDLSVYSITGDDPEHCQPDKS